MEKTRFSVREKKILLFLHQQNNEGLQMRGEGGYQPIKKIFALDPIKTQSWTSKSGEVRKYSYRSKDSIRRTLVKLRKNGYVRKRSGSRNWSFYKLTDKGIEKAEKLNLEIMAFIEEWQPFLYPGTDIKP